jgi:Aerotolerance regulator N-terminal/CARDB
MTFLNPLLLIATLGIGLPILAHLLNRFQVQHTEWAAMQFLNRSVRVRSRQIKLRDLLLLILRCLALILLVFALARPAWSGKAASWIPGEKRAGVIIAIDGSFSMQQGEEASSRFRRALDRVGVISGKIHRGDPVTLILLGGENRVLARNMAFDPERWDAIVQQLKATPASLDWDQVPMRLKELAADMDAPGKEIYIVTDMQARDWKNRSSKFREDLTNMGAGARVFMVPVPGEPGNLAVTGLDLVSGVLRKGTIARYQATVKNCGKDPVSNVEVQCKVEGVQIDSKTIPLIAAGASETVSLFVPFHNSGPTPITAEIGGDLLAADNVRRAVAVVKDRVSVICVDGSDGDAGRLIVAALMARGGGAADEDYVVRSVPWLSFPAENLSEVDVVVFADVPEITEEQAVELARFVRKGNGLVWFAGNNVKASAWNERAASGKGAILPARIGPVVDTGDALGAGKPLDPEMPDHHVCVPLRSLPEDLFSETRILRQIQVEPNAASFTVLQLAGSGAPILLEQSLGRGHVFMFTTTAETAWNNMALTTVFPMAMQQIVTYLAGREFERPRTVGDSLTLTYVEQPDASDAVFDTPSGETITVPVSEHRGQYVALLETAPEAGYYQARVSVQAPGLPIAVNVDSRESDVACLPESEFRADLEGLGLMVAASDDELAAAIDLTRTGRSAWRFFMIAALAFLILESLFADRLLTRGNSKRESAASPEPQNA